MGSAPLIPVSEYLATTYRPDRDYLEGVLLERNIGEQPHAQIQMIFGRIFGNHRQDWGVRVLGDQRVQITPERYRIPDVCVVRSSDPKDSIIRFAPLLCIEILSRGDTFIELQERIDDYAGLGVSHIWAVDPWRRRAWVVTTLGFEQPDDGTLRIPGTPIAIALPDLFAELERTRPLRRRLYSRIISEVRSHRGQRRRQACAVRP